MAVSKSPHPRNLDLSHTHRVRGERVPETLANFRILLCGWFDTRIAPMGWSELRNRHQNYALRGKRNQNPTGLSERSIIAISRHVPVHIDISSTLCLASQQIPHDHTIMTHDHTWGRACVT